jgi:hypothetical protein
MDQLRRMWSGRPEDAAHRSAVLRAMRAQSMEFSELNVEYGYCYQSAAVVPDGSAAPAPADDIRVYQPSTRPGAPLPHAWIDDEDGHRRPVKDLVTPGRFLLIAGEDGQAWCDAATQLAEEAAIAAKLGSSSTALRTSRSFPMCVRSFLSVLTPQPTGTARNCQSNAAFRAIARGYKPSEREAVLIRAGLGGPGALTGRRPGDGGKSGPAALRAG